MILDLLQEYQWRVGTVYPSAKYILEAPKPQQATPYHTPAIAMRTTHQMYVSAPDYGWKANQLYPSKQPKLNNLGSGYGQAPTQGVYTGIPSGCTANGTSGKAPY
jgi:hypothetical protein